MQSASINLRDQYVSVSLELWYILVIAKAYVLDWTTFFNRLSTYEMLSLVGIIPMEVCCV